MKRMLDGRYLRNRFVYEKWIKPLGIDNVLDIGCSWNYMKTLHRNTIGVDIEGSPDVIFNLESGLIPFKKNSFDCVICLDVLEHLDNLHDVLNQLVEISRRFIILSLPNELRWILLLQHTYKTNDREFGFNPRNRHKWFLSYTQSRDFIHNYARQKNLIIYNEFVSLGKISKILHRLLKSKFPNLMPYRYFVVIMKRGRVMNKMSACIIVKNEEDVIGNCLKSIKDVVDEIIIIDGYSTDKTVEICKRYTDKVFRHKWSGSFSKERNYSLSKAMFDWILVMDADETLSENLAIKIKELTQDDVVSGYHIPRLKICKNNKALRHGRAYPDYQLRLFNKTKGKYIRDIHETVELKGRVEKLGFGYDILHHISFDSDYIKRQIRFARIHSKRASLMLSLFSNVIILWKFFTKRGFIDGSEGFKYHILKMFYCWVVLYFIIRGRLGGEWYRGREV